MTYNKMKIQELKKLITAESILQKGRKNTIKEKIAMREDTSSFTWEIRSLQAEIFENSNKLTHYYQEYNLARNKKNAHENFKFNFEIWPYRNDFNEIPYETYVLYLDIDEYVLEKTASIMANGYRLIKETTDPMNRNNIVENSKILHISDNKGELEQKLKKLNDDVDKLPEMKMIQELLDTNSELDKQNDYDLKEFLKEKKEIENKIKDIRNGYAIKRTENKNKISDLIWKVKTIKENKLKETQRINNEQ